jgi:PAS domain-containing protein
MRHVCAWCNCEYGSPDDNLDLDFVTHGICAECEEHFQGSEPEPLRRFLDRFAAPILCVDDDARVVAANETACRLLGKDPMEAEDTRFGNVAQCSRSRLPGGCGRTEHCVACAIRLTVGETLAGDGNVENRKAVVDRFDDAGHIRQTQFLVSTERRGNTVLLKIQLTD